MGYIEDTEKGLVTFLCGDWEGLLRGGDSKQVEVNE